MNENEMPDAYMADDLDDSVWRRLSFGDDRDKYVVVIGAVGLIGPIKKRRIPDLRKSEGVSEKYYFRVFLVAGGSVDLFFNSQRNADRARKRLMVKVEGAYPI